MRLTAEQWQRAKHLFELGLSIPESSRPDWLDQIASDDPHVRKEVESLLASADSDNGLLSGPVRMTVALPAESPALMPPGTSLGPWRVFELIGRGGMGEVYRAERCDGAYQQQVALKLVARGAGPQRGRFLQETQVLARLAHPNVARLIDAGTTADDRPYLVMEYVEGQVITDWCDQRQSSIVEILRLLCQVCDAVDAAHRSLIVHRDIKPSNVLVTAGGDIKLLDFGIAKSLDSDIDGELTVQAGVACTPQFAAPEQLLGQPVTVATDIYSLGVLAYRLLTHRLPRNHTTLMSAAAAAVSGDTEVIKKPSEAAAQQAAQAAQGWDVRQWAKKLEGDIDWIVLKCLQHDPGRRYRSASELAEDFRRHLQDMPVLARPDSLSYRLGRLVRRHRLTAVVASLAVLSLVAGVIGITWEAYQARAQAQRATAVKDFLIDIFKKNALDNPEGAKARNTTAEQLLAMGAQQIHSHLKEVPETRAEMLGTMGGLYIDLEMSGPAIAMFQDQVETLQALRGAKATAALAQAQVDLGDALTEGGKTNDSDRVLHEALESLDAIHDRNSLTRAKAYSDLGYNAYQTRPPSDPTAEQMYEEAARIVRSDYPNDPFRFHVEQGLAYVAEDAEHWDVAEKQYRATLAFAKTLEASGDRISEAKAYDRLGKYLARRQKYKEAEQDLRTAVALFTEVAGPGNVQTARAEGDLADALGHSGHPAEAEKLLDHVLQETEQAEGTPNSSKVTSVQLSLALVELGRGEFEAAGTLFQSAIDSPLHQGVAEDYRTVALGHNVEVMTVEGRLNEAGQALTQVGPLIVRTFGEKSSSYSNLRLTQAELLLAGGDAEGADTVFRAMRKAEEAAPPATTWRNSRAGLDLMQAEIAEGKAGDAVGLGQTLLAGLLTQPDADELINFEAPIQLWFGIALRSAGKSADALPHLRRAVALREQLDDAQSPWLAQARVALADCLIDLRQTGAAGSMLDVATAAMASHLQLAPQFTKPLAQARRHLQQQS